MKKNKNIKIFTFILLLCTIFSTLLFVNPNVNAESENILVSLEGATITWTDRLNNNSVLDLFNNEYFINLVEDDGWQKELTIWVNSVDTFNNSSNAWFRLYYVYGISNPEASVSSVREDIYNVVSGFQSDHITYSDLQPNENTPAGLLENQAFINFIQDVCDVEGGVWEPTYTLNGGFKFNTNFASSNFYSTDIDIDFTNYFAFPYSSNYPSFVNFTSITFQERDNTRAGVMYYRSEYGLTTAWTDDLINGLGFWNNYNNPTLITQFIKFNNVVVSEDIYNWLNSVGTFGDFDYTDIPDDSTGDTPNTSRFQWLINDIDVFMNLEPLPDLSFYDILLVFVSIPLLIYILKLFLGG